MRYEPPEPHKHTEHQNHRSNPFFTLVLLLLILVVGYKLINNRLYYTDVLRDQQPQTSVVTQEKPKVIATPQNAEQAWIQTKVRNNDSISNIFDRLQLDPFDLRTILKNPKASALKKLHPGQIVEVLVSDNPEPDSPFRILRTLRFKIDPRSTLIVQHDGETFNVTIEQLPVEIKTPLATVKIDNSVLTSGRKAGIPDSILKQLMGLFAWRIDFSNDIRKGDYFIVAYNEEFLNGKKIKTDEIQSAEFVNKGTAYYAIRYTDKSGRTDYYSSTGASIRKAFLRRPVTPSRISSPFSLGRMHPILGYVRPHKGTDFAAPYGTPIHATSDGRVKFAGRDGGYGRVVMLQHTSRILTLYAHMSRFADGLKVGKIVKQNQVIGYIGTSGLADGPHVHYEFHINNKAYDPMKVALPNAAPVSKAQLRSYLTYADQQIKKLDNYRQEKLGIKKIIPPVKPIPATLVNAPSLKKSQG